MAQRFGTITLLKLFAFIIRYYARNRSGINDDPNVNPTLFTALESCLVSVQSCHDSLKAVLPIGD